jgi:hypothetical protein
MDAQSALVFPPPCFDAIKHSRVVFGTAVDDDAVDDDPSTDTATGGAAARTANLNRVTSRVTGVQQKQEAVSLQVRQRIVQPVLEVDKFYIVLQRESPKLWIAQVTTMVLANESVSRKARLLPSTRGGVHYWDHTSHTCALVHKGDWAELPNHMLCSGGACPAGGSMNVRFFYPQVDATSSAVAWAKALLEGEGKDEPGWLKGYWCKKKSERSVNVDLGNIGPEIQVVISNKGSRIRMAVPGIAVFKATALQLLESGHPFL